MAIACKSRRRAVKQTDRPRADLSRLELRLTDPEAAALDAILGHESAWMMGNEVSEAGLDRAALGGLRDAGLVVRWDLGIDEAWTLTAWGAARLGVVVVEDNMLENPRWGYPSQDWKFVRGHRDSRIASVDPAWLASKAMTPLEAAIHEEEREQYLLDPKTGGLLHLFGMPVPIGKRTQKQRQEAARKAAVTRAANKAKAKKKTPPPKPKFGRWGRPIE